MMLEKNYPPHTVGVDMEEGRREREEGRREREEGRREREEGRREGV